MNRLQYCRRSSAELWGSYGLSSAGRGEWLTKETIFSNKERTSEVDLTSLRCIFTRCQWGGFWLSHTLPVTPRMFPTTQHMPRTVPVAVLPTIHIVSLTVSVSFCRGGRVFSPPWVDFRLWVAKSDILIFWTPKMILRNETLGRSEVTTMVFENGYDHSDYGVTPEQEILYWFHFVSGWDLREKRHRHDKPMTMAPKVTCFLAHSTTALQRIMEIPRCISCEIYVI